MQSARGIVCLTGLVLGSMAAIAPARCEEPAASLAPLYDAAREMAADPETQPQAIAKLKALIETHQANQRIYDKALTDLSEQFQVAGQEEEAIRYFVRHAIEANSNSHLEVLRKLISVLRVKQPEVFERVVVEMGLAAEPGRQTAQPTSIEELQAAILQRDDANMRDKALLDLQARLAEGDDAAKVRALVTLRHSLSAKFDRQPFRDLLVPLLASDDAQVRMMALTCFPGTTTRPEDLELVVPLIDDPAPEVRQYVATALIQISQGEAADVVVPALIRLLQDDHQDVVRASIQSQWGQYSDPQLDAVRIALADNPRHHHVAIYFNLSPQPQKSVEVCQRLVDELADPDWNNSGRAAWGLTFGVPDEARLLVEEGLLRALPEETNEYTRGKEFEALANVVSERSRAYLTQVAQSPTETDVTRETARNILARLEAAGQ